jgi:copper chaperone CopZ
MKKINMIIVASMLAMSAVADNVKFAISNMHCQNCANRVEKTLKETGSVKEVKVDIENKTVCVSYDEKSTTAEALLKVLTDAKFNAEIAKKCGGCKKHGEGGGCGKHKEGEGGCHKENK